jgi:hypothetical protein
VAVNEPTCTGRKNLFEHSPNNHWYLKRQNSWFSSETTSISLGNNYVVFH